MKATKKRNTSKSAGNGTKIFLALHISADAAAAPKKKKNIYI